LNRQPHKPAVFMDTPFRPRLLTISTAFPLTSSPITHCMQSTSSTFMIHPSKWHFCPGTPFAWHRLCLKIASPDPQGRPLYPIQTQNRRSLLDRRFLPPTKSLDRGSRIKPRVRAPKARRPWVRSPPFFLRLSGAEARLPRQPASAEIAIPPY
jgi:hypothetical protein